MRWELAGKRDCSGVQPSITGHRRCARGGPQSSGGASLKQNRATARPAQLKTLKNERQIGP
jgi:hypothetical protein